MNKVKLTRLELENVKRVSLVEFDITSEGLTLIGGGNAQGKTTILDSIAFALGGAKYCPSSLQREGSHANAHIKLTLSNGLIVERKGKNADLKVTDPSGQKAGQALLSSFIEELAINLPKFLQMNDKEKALQLVRILGIEDELAALDARENVACDERKDAKAIAKSKESYANNLPYWDDVPETLQDATVLMQKSGEILKRNEDNQRKRNQVGEFTQALAKANADYERADQQFEYWKEQRERAKEIVNTLSDDLETAKKSIEDLQDESTEEIQEQIRNMEDTNNKVRANLNKEKAEDDAKEAADKVQKAEDKVEEIRAERKKFLEGAKMPLPDLSVGKNDKGDPILLYQGKAWDCMSGMERIRVSTAIVKELKPECGFVLLDGLEAFDADNLKELADWLKAEDLQAIGTCVGTPDDCTIIIEDGRIKGATPTPEVKPQKKDDWV